MKNNVIILLGIKHSGKSTQGKLLAEHCSYPFIDIDDVITKITGKTPRDLYSQNGVNTFMVEEAKACEHVVKEFYKKNVIIATGGGICDNPLALQILAPFGKFVFINSPEEIVIARILKKAIQNPDNTWKGLPAYIAECNPKNEFQIEEIFHKFYVERTQIYSQIADVTINITNESKEENAKLIQKELGL